MKILGEKMEEEEEISPLDFVNVSIVDTLQDRSQYAIHTNLQNSISCKLSLSNLIKRKACTIQILMDYLEMNHGKLKNSRNMIDDFESNISPTSVHIFYSLMESSYDWKYSSGVLNNPKLLVMFKMLFLRFKSINTLYLPTNESTPKSTLLQTSINRKIMKYHHHYDYSYPKNHDTRINNIVPVLL
jgi:hypothetical protein